MGGTGDPPVGDPPTGMARRVGFLKRAGVRKTRLSVPSGRRAKANSLADAAAYRRDRRKDVLLQQHGYFALRFLAEDAGKHLDLLLDIVLTALAHCEQNRRR
jgi:hypothetical protein